MCIYACLATYHMSTFQYFTMIDVVKYVKGSGELLSECNIGDPERRRLKLKYGWHWFVLLPMIADYISGHKSKPQTRLGINSNHQ